MESIEIEGTEVLDTAALGGEPAIVEAEGVRDYGMPAAIEVAEAGIVTQGSFGPGFDSVKSRRTK